LKWEVGSLRGGFVPGYDVVNILGENSRELAAADWLIRIPAE